MVDKILQNEVYLALKKAIDAASLRHQVTATNIANVNTPGYKKADVAFEEELKKALEKEDALSLKTTHPKHIPSPVLDINSVKPRIIQSTDTTMRNDINNVDIDKELAQLTENNIIYNTLAQMISEKIKGLKNVIAEGRR